MYQVTSVLKASQLVSFKKHLNQLFFAKVNFKFVLSHIYQCYSMGSAWGGGGAFGMRADVYE